MKSYLERLYRYNQWANQGLLKHLKAFDSVSDDIKMRLSHVVAAEEIWYNRIQPLGFDLFEVFEIQPWEVLGPRLDASAQRWIGLVDQTNDFDQVIHYKNLTGKAFQTGLNDIMIHVANHGTYHRGQIATLLRQQGLEPINTDFITYSREHGA